MILRGLVRATASRATLARLGTRDVFELRVAESTVAIDALERLPYDVLVIEIAVVGDERVEFVVVRALVDSGEVIVAE